MEIPPPAPSAFESRCRLTPVHVLFYVLIAAGCGLRIAAVVLHNPLEHLWSDPLRHWAHAQEPLMPSPMALFDPPVYQMWLSLVQRMTMGIPGLIIAYAATLSVLAPWCWYRFLREALSSRTLALAGWAVLTLLPTWIGIYSYFMTETLLLPMLGLSLWMTMRAKRRPTVGTFLAMVLAWLLTGLTRGVTIPLAAVAALLVWWSHPNKVRTAMYAFLIIAGTLTPLAIRNHHFLYLWAPHGNGWLARIYAESGKREILLHFQRDGATWEYGFTSPTVDEKPFEPLWNWSSSRTGTVDVPVDFKRGTRDWEAALRLNAVDGATRRRLRFENMAYLFQGRSWPDNNPGYFMGRLANASRWLWLPMLFAVAGVSVWCWREVLRRPLLALMIATWFFFQAWAFTAVNEGRYRKPGEGLLIAQACLLIDSLCQNRARSKQGAMPVMATP